MDTYLICPAMFEKQATEVILSTVPALVERCLHVPKRGYTYISRPPAVMQRRLLLHLVEVLVGTVQCIRNYQDACHFNLKVLART